MNRRPAGSSGCAAAKACRPSREVLVRFPSSSVVESWSTVWAVDDAGARRAAAFVKLMRLSSVELLIQEVPPGQPATFGGLKSTWPIAAMPEAAAVKPSALAPVATSVCDDNDAG